MCVGLDSLPLQGGRLRRAESTDTTGRQTHQGKQSRKNNRHMQATHANQPATHSTGSLPGLVSPMPYCFNAPPTDIRTCPHATGEPPKGNTHQPSDMTSNQQHENDRVRQETCDGNNTTQAQQTNTPHTKAKHSQRGAGERQLAKCTRLVRRVTGVTFDHN